MMRSRRNVPVRAQLGAATAPVVGCLYSFLDLTLVGVSPVYGDLELETAVTEVARADNESLARAANLMVRALAEMRGQGWIDDGTAMHLAVKFAGEPLGEEEVGRSADGDGHRPHRKVPRHEGVCVPGNAPDGHPVHVPSV